MSETPTNRGISAKLRERVSDELKEFIIVAVYLYVYFTALAYLKFTILQAHGIPFAPFGLAAAKALICAKFVLIGRALHVGERFAGRPLAWPILHKASAFVFLLLVLNAAEEVVVGLIRHQTLWNSLANVDGGTLRQLIATAVIGLLILIPFFAFRALGEVFGERNLFRLFFGGRPQTQSGDH